MLPFFHAEPTPSARSRLQGRVVTRSGEGLAALGSRGLDALAFRSPGVPAGPYLKVDVEAGTTKASMFRILDDHLTAKWVKTGFAFLFRPSENVSGHTQAIS